jgi:hypothetical protein
VVTATEFGGHVNGRAIADARATRDIRNLDLLSLETDMIFFEQKKNSGA